jgi:subtilisin family serine protease
VAAANDQARWHLGNINAAAARARGLDGSGVLVGVLDTGIDARHDEFQGKTIYFREFDADGTAISEDARDAGDHGTHVCALIAGATCGVAPKAELAVAAVLTQPTPQGMSGTLVQILNGLEWLVRAEFDGPQGDPGVDVINASLGGEGYDDYLYRTIETTRNAFGTQMIAAIGNSGRDGINHHGSPGNYDISLGIGAIDRNDDVANFSDWGRVPEHGNLQKPDFCAPGVQVFSATPGDDFARMSGTSMATPITAGAAALLLQRTPEFGLDADGLVDALSALLRPHVSQANRRRGGRGCLDLTNI